MKKQWILIAVLSVVLIAAIAGAVIMDGVARESGREDSLSGDESSFDSGSQDTSGITDGTEDETQESDQADFPGSDDPADTNTPSSGESAGGTDTPSAGNGTEENGSGEDNDAPASGGSGETGDTENAPETPPIPDQDDPILQGVTYQMYQSMTGEERQTFFDSFASMNDFLAWLDVAKTAYEYEKDQNTIDGDKGINLGELLGKK